MRVCRSLLLVLVLFPSLLVFGQPENEQKREAALRAFNEAIDLRGERKYRSYLAALEKFQLSVKLYLEAGDNESAARSRLGVGLIKNLIGEKDEALKIYLEVLEIFQKSGDATMQGRTLNNLGNLYSDLGEGTKAVDCHLRALEFRKKTRDRDGEASSLNSLGSAYADIGERKLALDAYTNAIVIRREIGDDRTHAIVLNNLGLLYNDLGDPNRSAEYFRQSLVLRRKSGDRYGESTTLNNLGLAIIDSEPSVAIKHFGEALSIRSQLGFEASKATILNNIGNAYLRLNDLPKALGYFNSALSEHEKSGDKSGMATALNNVGWVSIENRAPQFNTLNRSLLLARETQDRGLEAIVLSNLMRAYNEASSPAAAIFFGKQCVNKYQELRSAIKDLDRAIQKTYLSSIADEYRYLIDILIANGRFEDANAVLRMLKDEEFFGFVRRDADEIRGLSQRADLSPKEKELLQKYAALADRVSQLGVRFQRLDDKRRLLLSQDGQLSAAEEQEFQRLSSELAEAGAAFKIFLEKTLINDIGAENVRKINADRQLQSKLRRFGPGTVAISTIVSDQRYRVFVTTPTVQVAGKTEITATDLNKKIFAFRRILEDPKSDPLPLAKELYDVIVKPIERVLKDSGAETIVWSLDGTLRYIPIAALSPDGKSYLVERYRNVVVTAQTRDDIGDSGKNLTALGMGVSKEQTVFYPDYPDVPVTFQSLPGVEAELKSLIRDQNGPAESGILAGRRFLNDSFTLKNLTDSLARQTADGRKEFSVVHLASHFRLAGDWSSSFLVMGNGKILTLEELGTSPVLDFSDVELVTLSACNTASSEDWNGSEVESFASLIQTRNAKAVLATLWAVDDDSTAAIMNSFYTYLKDNPKATKADAIRYAQKSLVASENGRFAHPSFWAPFVLMGNWR